MVRSRNQPRRKKKEVKTFNNLACVRKMKSDIVLLFHGRDDDLIPYQHSKELEEEIKRVKHRHKDSQYLKTAQVHLLNNRGHNNIVITEDITIKVFRELLRCRKRKRHDTIGSGNSLDMDTIEDTNNDLRDLPVKLKSLCFKFDEKAQKTNTTSTPRLQNKANNTRTIGSRINPSTIPSRYFCGDTNLSSMTRASTEPRISVNTDTACVYKVKNLVNFVMPEKRT